MDRISTPQPTGVLPGVPWGEGTWQRSRIHTFGLALIDESTAPTDLSRAAALRKVIPFHSATSPCPVWRMLDVQSVSGITSGSVVGPPVSESNLSDIFQRNAAYANSFNKLLIAWENGGQLSARIVDIGRGLTTFIPPSCFVQLSLIASASTNRVLSGAQDTFADGSLTAEQMLLDVGLIDLHNAFPVAPPLTYSECRLVAGATPIFIFAPQGTRRVRFFQDAVSTTPTTGITVANVAAPTTTIFLPWLPGSRNTDWVTLPEYVNAVLPAVPILPEVSYRLHCVAEVAL